MTVPGMSDEVVIVGGTEAALIVKERDCWSVSTGDDESTNVKV